MTTTTRLSSDFDFLVGRWDVEHHRLRRPLTGSDEWDTFSGSVAAARTYLDGAVSIDEISFPDHGSSGMSFRLYTPRTGDWSVWWVSSRDGKLQPPVHGRWVDGVSRLYGDDSHEGTPVRVTYTWSDVTEDSARWQQAFSADDGQTWETNWVMRLRRTSAEPGDVPHDHLPKATSDFDFLTGTWHVRNRRLRAVLTHHVIFSWNRLGLSQAEQSTLATLAKEAVMHDMSGAASASEPGARRTSLGEVDNEMIEETSTRAVRLRDALVDQLCDQGTVRTERVEAALRAVPRHRFVPAVSVEEAYADAAVYTKHDGTGASISAASQPTIVAMMLEQLQAEPGQRVLELGAGTGYNAGLLAHLVGEEGHITTIDVDDDIVVGARSGLVAAGFDNVEVIHSDGALGYADGAPYDRIIATVGAWDLPSAWLDQLAPDGRLVVPLRLRGSVSRSIVFERDNGHWRSTSSEMSTFMPLRDGIADDPRRFVDLASDGTVTLQLNQEQMGDADTLAGVLDHPRSETWTGVVFRGPESFEWLDLWLACRMDNALSRMSTARSAVDIGLVTPQFSWGAMAVTDKGNLAYLGLRPAERTRDGTALYEVGVIGHGPGGGELTSEVVSEIRTWDRDFRSRMAQFEIQTAGAQEPITGQFVFTTPRNRLAIAWH